MTLKFNSLGCLYGGEQSVHFPMPLRVVLVLILTVPFCESTWDFQRREINANKRKIENYSTKESSTDANIKEDTYLSTVSSIFKLIN